MSLLRLERAAHGIVHLVMDDPAHAANVLDAAALAELDAALAELAARSDVAGVLVRGGRPGTFATGAEVEALGPVADRGAAVRAIERAQATLARLADLSCPTVAAMDGPCLGVGTELALACESRLAADEPRTRIGLPDVVLGFCPALGATTRLVRLVGLRRALELLLEGRLVGAREAERIGLVARAVPAATLLEQAERRLAEAVARRARGSRPAGDRWRPRSIGEWLADGTAAGRSLTLGRAAAHTRARTRGEYPAPVAILAVLRHAPGRPRSEAMRVEREWAADLLVGPVCRNLVRASRLVRPSAVELSATLPIERLQIVGTQDPAAELAELASRHGLEVRLRDNDPAALAEMLRRVRARIAGRAAREAPPAVEAQLARLRAGLEPTGLALADLAVELVAEDLDVRRRVYGELEVRMRPDAVLATGSATLGVDELAAGLAHPERFVGLRFAPAPRPLVEVVRGARSADAAISAAAALVRRLGRIPVIVRDTPGFAVGRVAMAGMREALHLLEDGYRLADVDAALRGFGMAAGPFEAMDEMGLAAVAALAATLARAFPARFAPAPVLEALVAAGRPGRRGGAGFHRYRSGRRSADPRTAHLLGIVPRRRPGRLEALAERVVLAMLNEGARLLEEGVVADADALDLVALHGVGFPPFRGGLLRHADELGAARVESRLNALRAENGERFRPAEILSRLAGSDGSFTAPVRA
jgi:3-hydroxyacyl-CoA dehydrogenase/1,4-dihydroxy-2-naphthoyl-CoA synthase